MKTKNQKKQLAKENYKFDYQDDNELINEEELKNRKGFSGDKKHFFMAILRAYHSHNTYHNHEDNITGLAEAIYELKIFYVKIHNQYKLMKFSSIKDNLYQWNTTVMLEIKKEKEEKERLKSKR